MAYVSTNPMFQSLSDEKEKDFRDYARETDPPKLENWVAYHPVCRQTWIERDIMPTPINSIAIPPAYLELCPGWHAGQNCLLYAIASTGGLTLGTQRPANYTATQWYLSLWQGLSEDIAYATRSGVGHTDYPTLVGFEEWVDKIVDRLTIEYGLENWEK